MGDVLIKGGSLEGERITELRVHLHNLPERVIDRDTAMRWMRDGHSMIPLIGGERGPALQLVEAGDDELFIRADTAKVATDSLPELPPAR